MATLSIVPSPSNALGMMSATARVPLRDAPSAVLNSPMGRSSQHQQLHQVTAGVKRSRADLETNSTHQHHHVNGHSLRDSVISASTQGSVLNNSGINMAGRAKTMINVQVNAREESLSGLHKRSAAGPTALQRKLEAARGVTVSRPSNLSTAHGVDVRKAAAHEQTMENVRVWQKHYRKAFPTMVFYFDGLPKDMMHKLSHQVRSLGAVCLSEM
jgi:regulatory subunit for Cdc7p protein kinase